MADILSVYRLRRTGGWSGQGKLPFAAAGGIGDIRVAADAPADESCVDDFGKLAVFDNADGFARVKGQTLSFAGTLDAAIYGGVRQGIAVDLDAVLVDIGVEAQPQCFGQTCDSGIIGKLQEFFDSGGFDNGEALPDCGIVVHRFVHTQLALDGLKPHAVHRQPVFGTRKGSC